MADKKIWLPDVVHESTQHDPITITGKGVYPSIEQSRMMKADHLRRSLTKMRNKYFLENVQREIEKNGGDASFASKWKMKPAVMAVERWFMHNSLRFPASRLENADRDAVFPMFTNMVSYREGHDDCMLQELIADLCVAKDREEDAREIAKELLKLSHSLALELQVETAIAQSYASATAKTNTNADADTGGIVTLVSHKHTLDLIFSSSFKSSGAIGKKRQLLKLNPLHYAKLQAQYEKFKGITITSLQQQQQFLNSVFCLLARYQTIQGHGFQAAVAELAFGVLHKDLGVDLEVFASPLNSTFALHCSAFKDTDACFGSIGSFFDFHPTTGSYECNPPFVLAVMDAMTSHIDTLFKNATGALSFTVVVPKWEEASFYIALEKNTHLKRIIVISKAEHGFCDGAAFQRQDRYRDSPYDTVLFLLQNDEGCVKWPCSDECERRIRLGFRQGIPTEGMRLRQAKDGRGTADECRGVYKGANKNKTGEGVMKRKRDELKEKRKAKKQKVKQYIKEKKLKVNKSES
jgi:hypothetical protein